MRAAVFHGNRDIRIEEVPEPTLGPGEVLLRVRATGICGTDASEFEVGPRMFPVQEPDPRTGHLGPMVPGHELAGVVQELGAGVSGFEIGDLLVSGAGISCGTCDRCIEGRTNLCERYTTVGLQRDGGLAQFVSVPAATCVRAPEGLSADAAALGQPMAIAVHSMRRGEARPGELALVIGVGGIGAFLTYALAASGVRVVAADLEQARLEAARALGARLTVRPDLVDVASTVRAELGEPDVVYEVTGTEAGLSTALEIVRRGGRIVIVGLHDRPSSVDLRALTLAETNLIGTNAHVCGADLPEALRLLAARAEPWDDVAPVALSLDRLVEDGIEPLAHGRSTRIKTLVDPWAERTRPTRMDPDQERADVA